MAAVFMKRPVANRFGALDWFHVTGIAFGEILLYFAAAYLADRLAGIFDRPPPCCPKCGGKMKHAASGSYDFSAIPHYTELMTVFLFAAVNGLILLFAH